MFIMGPRLEAFEKDCAAFLGVKHALGVSSGTDALLLALMALDIGEGDEVLLPSFTFFATAGSVARLGATPVWVDVNPHHYQHRSGRRRPEGRSAHACDHAGAPLRPVRRSRRPAGLRHQVSPPGDRRRRPVDGRPLEGPLDDVVRRLRRDELLPFEEPRRHGRFRPWSPRRTTPSPSAPASSASTACSRSISTARSAPTSAWIRSRRPCCTSSSRTCRNITARARVMPTSTTTCASRVVAWHRREPPRRRQGRARSCCRSTYTGQGIWNQFTLRVLGGRRDALKAFLTARKIGCEIYYPIPLHRQQCFVRPEVFAAHDSVPVSEQSRQPKSSASPFSPNSPANSASGSRTRSPISRPGRRSKRAVGAEIPRWRVWSIEYRVSGECCPSYIG